MNPTTKRAAEEMARDLERRADAERLRAVGLSSTMAQQHETEARALEGKAARLRALLPTLPDATR